MLLVPVTFYSVGTNRYFRKVAERMNIQTTFVDATDLGLVRASMRPNTKVTDDIVRLMFLICFNRSLVVDV